MALTKLVEKMDIWPKNFGDSTLEEITNTRGTAIRFDPNTKIKIGKRVLYPGLFISGGDQSKECKTLVENGKEIKLSESESLWPNYQDPHLQIMSVDSGELLGIAVKYDTNRVLETPTGKRYLGTYFDSKTGEYGKILVKFEQDNTHSKKRKRK